MITSGSPDASSSKVCETEPSTLFSSGTKAASTSPLRTASKTAVTVSNGIKCASLAVASCKSAASVKVPRGPK